MIVMRSRLTPLGQILSTKNLLPSPAELGSHARFVRIFMAQRHGSSWYELDAQMLCYAAVRELIWTAEGRGAKAMGFDRTMAWVDLGMKGGQP
jgi:hypothetical protein